MPPRPANSPAPLIWTQPVIWTQPAPAGRPRDLDRERIVRAAIEVADEGGAPALTMAAVARRLGSYTPMALYRHVTSKDGLIDLMLDRVAGEVTVPDEPGRDWRADLRALAQRSWEMVVRHSWFAQLVHTRPPLGPNMMRRTEFVLEVLTRRGATVADAMTYAALLDRHVFGSALQAAEERSMFQRHGIASMEELTAAITAVRTLATADGSYPILSEWMASPTGASPDEQFELSITFLLDGIASRLPKRRGKAQPGRGETSGRGKPAH